jgi:N-acetylglucosaminyldiphosphoundecaprenol N-acetyl-beta-D-mannosaminyltransferase
MTHFLGSEILMNCSCKKSGILGTAIAITDRAGATQYILSLTKQPSPAYVCFATAHMIVEAAQNKTLRAVYDSASLIFADGRSIYWALQLTGNKQAACVSGPQLTPELLKAASDARIPVGFYGGRPETLEQMLRNIRRDYPDIEVPYFHSPPFRTLNDAELSKVRKDVRSSGVKLLFVGLGSPKQEIWMSQHIRDLPCVLLGVGAVFEILSGEKALPPVWVQNLGLNWLARLCQEPRRLLKRNLYSPLFVMRFLQHHILPRLWNKDLFTDQSDGSK